MTSTTSTTTTPANLEAVLAAARDLLGARQDRMLTVEEWANLARAVAACTGLKAADLLGEDDLRDAAEGGLAWDPTRDGRLPESDL